MIPGSQFFANQVSRSIGGEPGRSTSIDLTCAG